MPKPDLTNRELLTFVHNAQLALLDRIPDSVIPTIYSYKNLLLDSLSTSTLSPTELSSILISAAWQLISNEVKKNGKKQI